MPNKLSLRQQGYLDLVGASASFLCALHCALLPLALVTLPLLEIHWLSSHRFDFVFAGIALLYGLYVIGRAYVRHEKAHVWIWYLLSCGCLVLGLILLRDSSIHSVFMVLGGGLLGFAHLMNHKAIHACKKHYSHFSMPVDSQAK